MNASIPTAKSEAEARRERFEEAVHMQAVEGNPFTAEDHALFAEFERAGLTDDEQRARIVAESKRTQRPLSAE